MNLGNLNYSKNFMIRLNLSAIGLVSILALTGCNTAQTTSTTDSAGKAVTDTAGAAKDKVADTATAAKDKATDAATAAKDKAADAATAAKDKATDAATAAKDKAAAVAGAAKDTVNGTVSPELASLAGVVTKTKSAVDSGNFEQAKMEAAKLDDLWSKAEAGVKSKSPAAYQAISTGLTSATGAVNEEDKAKAQTALTALSKALTTAK